MTHIHESTESNAGEGEPARRYPARIRSASLLVAVAFARGLAWGELRIATGSVVAPVVAPVVRDVGVLVAWPLA